MAQQSRDEDDRMPPGTAQEQPSEATGEREAKKAKPNPATSGAAPQGDDAVEPGPEGGRRLTGSAGISSGLQPGGTSPGGGPGSGLGSIGTGGASSGGSATGSVKRGGS